MIMRIMVMMVIFIFSGRSRETQERRQRDANSTTMMLVVVIAVFVTVEIPLSVIGLLHIISSRWYSEILFSNYYISALWSFWTTHWPTRSPCSSMCSSAFPIRSTLPYIAACRGIFSPPKKVHRYTNLAVSKLYRFVFIADNFGRPFPRCFWRLWDKNGENQRKKTNAI